MIRNRDVLKKRGGKDSEWDRNEKKRETEGYREMEKEGKKEMEDEGEIEG